MTKLKISHLLKMNILLIVGLFFINCVGEGLVSSSSLVSPSNLREGKILSDSSSSTLIFIDSYLLFKEKPRNWQGCPTLAVDRNGIFYAAWFTGGKTEEPGNYITLSTSNDTCKTWIANRVLITPLEKEGRHIDPILWVDEYSLVHLSWTKSDGMWDGGIGGVWDIIINNIAGDIRLSKPRRLFNGVMNTKPLVIKNRGIIFPVFGWNFNKNNSNSLWNGYPIKLTEPLDNGAFLYFAKSSDIVNKDIIKLCSFPVPSQNRWADEHMVVNIDSLHFLGISRNFKGVHYTQSIDGGYTWTPSRLFSSVGVTAESKSFLGKLESGALLLVTNNSRERTSLCAFLSTDNGKTWPYKIVIDSRQDVSYPDVIETSDGIIHVIYDRERYKAKEILHCSFTEKDIIEGQEVIKKDIVSN